MSREKGERKKEGKEKEYDSITLTRKWGCDSGMTSGRQEPRVESSGRRIECRSCETSWGSEWVVVCEWVRMHRGMGIGSRHAVLCLHQQRLPCIQGRRVVQQLMRRRLRLQTRGRRQQEGRRRATCDSRRQGNMMACASRGQGTGSLAGTILCGCGAALVRGTADEGVDGEGEGLRSRSGGHETGSGRSGCHGEWAHVCAGCLTRSLACVPCPASQDERRRVRSRERERGRREQATGNSRL